MQALLDTSAVVVYRMANVKQRLMIKTKKNDTRRGYSADNGCQSIEDKISRPGSLMRRSREQPPPPPCSRRVPKLFLSVPLSAFIRMMWYGNHQLLLPRKHLPRSIFGDVVAVGGCLPGRGPGPLGDQLVSFLTADLVAKIYEFFGTELGGSFAPCSRSQKRGA